MTAVNPKLPMELSDGTPVTNHNHPYPGILMDQFVFVSLRREGRTVSKEFQLSDGKPRYGMSFHGLTLRNVVPTLNLTGPLQTRDGKKARYIGKLDNGQLLFGITYAGYTGHEATELRYADGRKSPVTGQTSGDDIVAKIVERVTYQNVYADGTVGQTKHSSEDNARSRTKYGKVRVGVLKTTYHNDVRVSAVVNSSVIGWFRSAACPKGREATREDFARG